jgi:uncharacterized protein YcbX
MAMASKQMRVAEIWRYPVKSLKGERLKKVEVGLLGIERDREIVIVSETGHVLNARAHPKLLALQGAFDDTGGATVNGHRWDSPAANMLVREAAGQPARLVRIPGPERFDVLPLLVATDGAIQEMGIDGRRLRPNIVLSGVDGLAERDWPGMVLSVGHVRILAEQLRMRCVMTTYDPDTQAQDRSVLQRIVDRLDGEMALDCRVLQAGRIWVGAEVSAAGEEALHTRNESHELR